MKLVRQPTSLWMLWPLAEQEWLSLRPAGGGQTDRGGGQSLGSGYIRRRLSVAAVKAQCFSLLGRLEGLGPGAVTAAGRRRTALEQERLWAKERRGDAMSARQGYNIVRRGFARLD